MKAARSCPFPRLVSRIVVLRELLLHLRKILLQYNKGVLYTLETHLLISFVMDPGRILHVSEVLDLLTAILDLDQTYGSRRALEEMSKHGQLGEITCCAGTQGESDHVTGTMPIARGLEDQKLLGRDLHIGLHALE